MKITIKLFSLCVTLASQICLGQSNAISKEIPINCVISDVRSNLFVGFQSPLFNGRPRYNGGVLVFPSGSPISFGFGATGDVPHDIFALRKEYGCIISARSAAGVILEETREGGKYGRKVQEVTSCDRKLLDDSKGQGNSRGSPYYSVARVPGIEFSRRLPPLEDLLKFDKPGMYGVTIELQCFVGPYCASTFTNMHLVKFPPVTLRVVKEENN